MAFSHPENLKWMTDIITTVIKPATVLDVGAGGGKYGSIVKLWDSTAHITALEVWEPYVEMFKLRERYDEVLVTDVRTHDNFDYDLVVLGDVLEHMSEVEAMELWKKVSAQARYAVVSIPIVHYHQGEEHGNPFQRHVEEDWTHDKVMASFSGITQFAELDVVGVYMADFKRAK